MAAVISISSDEEQCDESTKHLKKKIKTGPVIYLDLDDEEENKCKLRQDVKIIIESDEEVLLDSKTYTDIKDAQTKKEVPLTVLFTNKQAEEIIESDRNKTVIESPANNSFNCKNVENMESDQCNTSVIEISSDNVPENESKLINNLDLNEQKIISNHENVAQMFEGFGKMQIFINSCLSQINDEDTKNLFISKLPFCKQLIDKVDDEYIHSNDFNAFLDEKIAESKKSSLVAISSFNDIYQHLKKELKKVKTNVEVTNKSEIIIGKLEHVYRKVQKAIVKLEQAEVDFDEEEDSSYIKMQRYRERAVKLYEKICKYKKENARASYNSYHRLDFSGSNFPEFNHAINKKFKDNSIFPTYYEVECCLKKAVKNKNMDLSEHKIKEEAVTCFKSVGDLIQKRRKIDLLNIHSDYLLTNDDPAFENPELDAKLKTNKKEAKLKIDEICEKYVKLEESGENPKLSSDSEDSKRESTEDENEDE